MVKDVLAFPPLKWRKGLLPVTFSAIKKGSMIHDGFFGFWRYTALYTQGLLSRLYTSLPTDTKAHIFDKPQKRNNELFKFKV